VSERVDIPRTARRQRNVAPCPAWGRDNTGAVFIRCACGLPMDLDRLHVVAADGNVHPSLHHDDGACGWHEWGRLLDWDGGQVHAA
jgi:hypothetical protein